MSNALELMPGKKYKVIKPFADFDRVVHEMGEEWIFLSTNFVPYDDGLSVHTKSSQGASEEVFRLQWRNEEQAEIIENFHSYVTGCSG